MCFVQLFIKGGGEKTKIRLFAPQTILSSVTTSHSIHNIHQLPHHYVTYLLHAFPQQYHFSLLSEIETLTGEDTAERVEMALGKPITSREQSPERTLQERKLQNNVIIAP